MDREKWKPANCDFLQFVRWAVKVTLNLLITGFKNMSCGRVEAVAKARAALSLLLTGEDLMNNAILSVSACFSGRYGATT